MIEGKKKKGLWSPEQNEKKRPFGRVIASNKNHSLHNPCFLRGGDLRTEGTYENKSNATTERKKKEKVPYNLEREL